MKNKTLVLLKTSKNAFLKLSKKTFVEVVDVVDVVDEVVVLLIMIIYYVKLFFSVKQTVRRGSYNICCIIYVNHIRIIQQPPFLFGIQHK